MDPVTCRFCAQRESARNAGETTGCGTADGAARRTPGIQTGARPVPAGRGCRHSACGAAAERAASAASARPARTRTAGTRVRTLRTGSLAPRPAPCRAAAAQVAGSPMRTYIQGKAAVAGGWAAACHLACSAAVAYCTRPFAGSSVRNRREGQVPASAARLCPPYPCDDGRRHRCRSPPLMCGRPPMEPEARLTRSSSERDFRACSWSTGCASWVSPCTASRRARTSAARGTGTATRVLGATRRACTTPIRSWLSWSRNGRWRNATRASRRSCGTCSTWRTACSCASTSPSAHGSSPPLMTPRRTCGRCAPRTARRPRPGT